MLTPQSPLVITNLSPAPSPVLLPPACLTWHSVDCASRFPDIVVRLWSPEGGGFCHHHLMQNPRGLEPVPCLSPHGIVVDGMNEWVSGMILAKLPRLLVKPVTRALPGVGIRYLGHHRLISEGLVWVLALLHIPASCFLLLHSLRGSRWWLRSWSPVTQVWDPDWILNCFTPCQLSATWDWTRRWKTAVLLFVSSSFSVTLVFK